MAWNRFLLLTFSPDIVLGSVTQKAPPQFPQSLFQLTPLHLVLVHVSVYISKAGLQRANHPRTASGQNVAFQVQQEPLAGGDALEGRVRRSLSPSQATLRCYPFLWLWHFHVGEDQLLKFWIL